MATAKQLAWRKKFVAMVRAHKFKRRGRKGRDAARTRKGTGVRQKNPSGVRIVHNKLLGGWFIVRGPHQTPLGGRFNSKAEAQAHLQRKKNPSARFTDSQLSRLRAAYSKLDRIDPGKSGYKLLAAYLSNLTQPQLKQLADAEIKFLSKLARNRVSKSMHKNPIKGPGKFEGSTFAGKYAYENADKEIGSVDELGWFGNFSGKIKGRGPFHIIVSEDNQGFVYDEFFDTKEKMLKRWNKIEHAYEKFYDESESE